jgi:DNA (cytosine-5)-methyltransferase 1
MGMPKPLTFIDAFAGCGGLSLGLMQAGLLGKFAIEHDSFAFATLKANLLSKTAPFRYSWPRWLPKEPLSITSLLGEYEQELAALSGSIDVLVGGPPCQGFSMAGRRQHDDPRNQLFEQYLRLVEIIKPKIVLIENVRGFTMDFAVGENVTNYAGALRTVLSEDYKVYERLLNLSQFGVPQARTRYFVIAVKSLVSTADPFTLLEGRIPSFLRALGISAPVSSSNAISDLEVDRCGTEPSKDTKGFAQIAYGRPLTRYQKLMNESGTTPSDLRLARHAEDITLRFQEIIDLCHAEGRLNTSISTEVRERFGLKKRALRVLDPDRPSPTITSMPDDLIHYSEPRTLTVRENARLQSFPDWFAFQGKYTTGGHLRKKEVPRFTQVANAVPPLVARAIGEMLTALMADATQARQGNTEQSSLQRVRKSTEIFAEA